jgi:hypothetical protein
MKPLLSEVAITELEVGDVVQQCGSSQPWNTMTVKKIDKDFVWFFRPYVHTCVSCSVGIEEFPIELKANIKFDVLRRDDKTPINPPLVGSMAWQYFWYNEDETSIFVDIPAELAQPAGECCCDYCKAHPELTSRWDMMGIALLIKDNRTWTVHNPTHAGLHWPKRT